MCLFSIENSHFSRTLLPKKIWWHYNNNNNNRKLLLHQRSHSEEKCIPSPKMTFIMSIKSRIRIWPDERNKPNMIFFVINCLSSQIYYLFHDNWSHSHFIFIEAKILFAFDIQEKKINSNAKKWVLKQMYIITHLKICSVFCFFGEQNTIVMTMMSFHGIIKKHVFLIYWQAPGMEYKFTSWCSMTVINLRHSNNRGDTMGNVVEIIFAYRLACLFMFTHIYIVQGF